MKVEAAVFSDVLGKNIQYRVPTYQRRYQWTREEWIVLWDDLDDCCKKRAENAGKEGRGHEHFVGAIVRHPVRVSENVQIYDLIDGQQRLTTIMILMRVIATELRSRPSFRSHAGHQELARKIDAYLSNVGASTAEFIPRLIPSRDDRENFRRVMAGAKGADEAGIDMAVQFFERELRRYLRELEDNCRYDALRRLLETICSGLSLALLTLDEYDQEYEIFESLNAKGMQMEESDKVRNFCFLHLDKLPQGEMERFHQERWLIMEETLSPVDKRGGAAKLLNRFMMSWTFMKTGWLFAENKLYAKLIEYLEDHARKVAKLQFTRSSELAIWLYPFFEELTDYAPAFKLIAWPDKMADAVVAKQIKHFVDTFGLRTAAHPLLLYLLRLHLMEGGANRESLLRCLEVVESYVVRRYVCKITKGESANQRVFARIANQLYRDAVKDLGKCVLWLESKLHGYKEEDRWPDDKEFAQYFETYECSDGDEFATYVLKAIENASSTRASANELDECGLNRVMPDEKGMTQEWAASVGTDALEVHRQWRNRFGNLILLSGKHDSSFSFEETKTVCKNSNFETTKEICISERWNTYAMQTRSNRLFEKARRLWSFPSQ